MKKFVHVLLISYLSAAPSWAANCSRETVRGSWVFADDPKTTFAFLDGGDILCAGKCNYSYDRDFERVNIGRPIAWEMHGSLVQIHWSARGTQLHECAISAGGRVMSLDQFGVLQRQ